MATVPAICVPGNPAADCGAALATDGIHTRTKRVPGTNANHDKLASISTEANYYVDPASGVLIEIYDKSLGGGGGRGGARGGLPRPMSGGRSSGSGREKVINPDLLDEARRATDVGAYLESEGFVIDHYELVDNHDPDVRAGQFLGFTNAKVGHKHYLDDPLVIKKAKPYEPSGIEKFLYGPRGRRR